MKIKHFLFLIVYSFLNFNISAQNIADFTSVNPGVQTEQFIIPSTHAFQKIIEKDDNLTEGGTMPRNIDFTGYLPISGSSVNGYLSINSEAVPGGVVVVDINFNSTTKLWQKTVSQSLDFSAVGGTIANCSGTVTPWDTVITCEEYSISTDNNSDGYYDFGWNVEIDPATKTVLGKLWAMGNFSHENVTIHSNERTVYQGADVILSGAFGYLYKFVATNAQDLTDGLLYVYKGSKNGSGNWILINNTTQTERNETYIRSGADPDPNDADSDYADATVFNGIEDVEIGPDGMVYFAVKGSPDERVYRFQDSDPITGTTVTMETFAGNMNYDIVHESGTTSVPWGSGNDNLAFDNQGNLWVFQDGGNNYIWVVENGHTQAVPKVKIFGIVPIGAEPTGITFTPDNKYLFMSVMHPDNMNDANQTDVEGNALDFNKDTALVIALNENLSQVLSNNTITDDEQKILIYPNPKNENSALTIKRKEISSIEIFNSLGQQVFVDTYNKQPEVNLDLIFLNTGVYTIQINSNENIKLLIN
jgi:secreted PhoX family phosphatase